MNSVERFIKTIRPRACDLTKVRVGGHNDGGYVVLEELCQSADSLFSFGIGDDISFEIDYLEKFPNTKNDELERTLLDIRAIS